MIPVWSVCTPICQPQSEVLGFVRFKHLGVWYDENPRVALRRVLSWHPDAGEYAVTSEDAYVFHPSDSKRGLIVRYVDDDGDVMEARVISKMGSPYDAAVEYRTVSPLEALPEDDRRARIPRTKVGQIYELRRLFRK